MIRYECRIIIFCRIRTNGVQLFLDGWISFFRRVHVHVECDIKRRLQRSDCHELQQLGAGRAELWRCPGVRVPLQTWQLQMGWHALYIPNVSSLWSGPVTSQICERQHSIAPLTSMCTGWGKKVTPKVFRSFLSKRLSFFNRIIFYWKVSRKTFSEINEQNFRIKCRTVAE